MFGERSGVHPPFTTLPLLQLRLKARPESALLLRRRLRVWLDEVDATNDDVFDVALACTEAFANAVEHPREPTSELIDIDGSIRNGEITINVHDYGTWRELRERQEGGYGFPLMRRHMDSVEVHSRPGETTVTMRRQVARAARLH
jgi:anti-sigma regulatory factor (Ser/Thr protein kinase)